ncbi:osteopetrosis-associated transmembrane protein 1 precursor [Ruminiclostridium sufflavum DSM 19573]|uniref:Osteopetrosis-associated transmembrane protein 1 n=1 Tax=Ruminiclostridium sufflavum DSM 19573 TaxID=1121337 RepID=A0A318XJ18_9FIRM|nr:zf-HC2 domain-containing protein [Ruminiclostridium sufflavum]PYG85698.1 osteopetrosis-associated transmembrane protein 1 precursor [Ruminiclostridium sufflavum DSM 19573]
MRCEDFRNHIMKFFDKELNDIEEAQLKQHLKICKNCSDEFNKLKEVIDFVEQDSEIEPPEDFELQVMSRIENEVKIYKNHSENNTFVFDILLISVTLIFVIFFGGLLFEGMKEPINFIQVSRFVADNIKDFIAAAISMGRAILIAVMSVTASIYKTYYFGYIILGILLFVTQGVFFKMVRQSNGGSQ